MDFLGPTIEDMDGSGYSYFMFDVVSYYSPDPAQPSKYKKVGRTLKTENNRCSWCKSSYSKEKEHCPNCGGPKIGRS